MYQAVENMGYQPGTVLEPSMGVGNFFGLLPESLSGAKLYGVELDDLTGRIARQLYQKADITISGFEKTDQRDFYDLAVGNVPFGQYQVNDPAYNKANHTSMQYEMQDKALKYYPQKIAEAKLYIEAFEKDILILQAHPVKDDAFSMTVMGQTYTERKDAGEAIIKACMLMSDPEKPMDLGEFRGFPMQLHCDGSQFRVTMKQNLTYRTELADDPVGNVTRINNALEGMTKYLEDQKASLPRLEKELANAQEESERPFPKEEELRQKSARLTQLNRELEKPTHKTAEHSQDKQDEDVEPDLEVGDTPAREPFTPVVVQGEKPSIRAAIRSYTPPAPASPGTDRSQRREAAL